MEKTIFSRNCRSKVWVFRGPCVQTMRLAKLTYVLDMPATGRIVWKQRQSWFGHASNALQLGPSRNGSGARVGWKLALGYRLSEQCASCVPRAQLCDKCPWSMVWCARYLATCVLASRAYTNRISKTSKNPSRSWLNVLVGLSKKSVGMSVGGSFDIRWLADVQRLLWQLHHSS